MTFTPADRLPEPDDPLLRPVVAELRRPASFDPAIDAAALRRIRAGRAAVSVRTSGWQHLALSAAVAASIALIVGLYSIGVHGRVAAPPGSHPVLLRLVAPTSSAVVVVGDFNDWNPAATPLEQSGTGEWTVRLKLLPGRYRYTFLVDGREWKRDPAEPPAPDNDYGPPLSVLTVS